MPIYDAGNTGQRGRKKWENWTEQVNSITTGTTYPTNTTNLPYIPEPLVTHNDGGCISYEDVEFALKAMGIDIPPSDIYSVYMNPEGVTVEYYATPGKSAARSRRVYPLTFERDQDSMWDWRTAV